MPTQDPTPSRDPAPRTAPPVSRAWTDLFVPPPDAPPPPAVPAGYELLERLGQGGMGVVYKARQLALKRDVALKFIRGGDLARFRAEAEALARLQHPHIVTVHEIGEDQGQPYCALEYLAGGSLAARLKESLLPPRAAAELIATLARAVQAAHDKGVVHRDLKPLNVLLTADGQPKVGDFGLVKFLDNADTGMTQAGQVMGTPSYMAPEQARGETTVGPAADVWALGAILYECLTGRPPFKGAGVSETLEQVRSREPVAPRQLQPGVPRDLETITLKCLEKEAARRYGSAQALSDDLGRWLRGEAIEARPVSALGRGWRWCRRNAGVAVASAVAALALVAGSASSVFFGLRAVDRAEAAEANEREANGQRKIAVANGLEAARLQKEAEGSAGREKAARALAERRQYVSDLRLAQGKFEVEDYGEVERLLARHAPADGAEDLRGFEWYYFRRRVDDRLSPPGRTFAAAVEVTGCALSPDGRSLAVGGGDATVRILSVADGKELMRLDVPRRGEEAARAPRALAYSPKGDRLAAVCGRFVAVFDLGTRKGTLLPAPVLGESGVTFSADGRWLAAVPDNVTYSPDGKSIVGAAGPMGGGVVFDADTGKVRRRWKGDTTEDGTYQDLPLTFEFSPDGKGLAEATRDGVALWEVEGDKPPRRLHGHTRAPGAMRFLAGGSYLISASPAEVIVWHLATGSVVRRLDYKLPTDRVAAWRQGYFNPGWTMRMEMGHHLALSPEGGYVVMMVSDRGLENRQLWVMDTVTGQTWQTRGGRPAAGTGHVYGGPRVAAGAYAAPIARAGPGREVTVCSLRELEAELESLPAAPWGGVSLATSPDGDRYVLHGIEPGRHTPYSWSARTHQPVPPPRPWPDPPVEREPLWSFSPSPDGQRLATVNLVQHELFKPIYRLHLRDARTGDALWHHDYHCEPIFMCHAHFSADGQRVALPGAHDGPRVYDAGTGRLVAELPAPPCEAACFGLDRGALLVQGLKGEGPRARGEVVEWDIGSRAPRRRFEGACATLAHLALCRELDLLAGGDHDGWLHIWQFSTGRRRQRLRVTAGAQISQVGFTPDRRRLAVRDTRRFTLWDPVLGEEVFSVTCAGRPDDVHFFAFAPDSQRLLGGFVDGLFVRDATQVSLRVPLWDARPLTPALRAEREARLAFRHFERTYGVRSQMLPLLKQDKGLSAPARELALGIAGAYREQPKLLAALARCYIYDPSRPAAEHQLAKAQLLTALNVHPAPKPVALAEELAAAHYRLGEWHLALKMLQLAEGVPQHRFGPAPLAILAMTHKRLGDDDRARSTLKRLLEAAPARRRQEEIGPGIKLAALVEEAERVVGEEAKK